VTLDDETESAAQRIVAGGRQEVIARLREAFIREAAGIDDVRLDPAELEPLVAGAAERAGGALWRRSLAQAATEMLGVGLRDAVEHPAVRRAHQLAGAPPYPPAPADGTHPSPASPSVDALRIPAVHLEGIESLRAGERDIELRFSDEGLDVLKASSGATIGRLRWQEIVKVELPRLRRGRRRKEQELHVATGRGQANFALPALTEDQRREHLEPLLAARGWGPPGGDDGDG
jgi:hypothetical protein